MENLSRQLFDALDWIRATLSRLSFRHDRAPIADVERVFHFVSTRSAFVTQKKLYGYLKERIGIRYPKMFDDEHFARSIDIAKMHVFAASLSDMTVHAVAHIGSGAELDAQSRRRLAIACYRSGIEDNAEQSPGPLAPQEWLRAFEARLDETLWENIAAGASAFTESPKALIKWAPIAEELKVYDREIVENSIRFAWNEIRQDFRKRLDAKAVVRDWVESGSSH